MNKIKFLLFILSLALIITAIPFVVFAEDGKNAEPEYYTFDDGMGKEEIPYGDADSVGTNYGHSNFKMMNEGQAAAAGVPEGYSGWVLALDPKGTHSISMGLDLTSIKVADIEKISIRVWCPTGTKQSTNEGGVRITGNGSTAWNMLASPSAIGEWIDIVLQKNDFTSFDYDNDGYCDPANFCFRNSTGTAYIDHITVELKAPDTTPPVITYSGETEIKTTAGKVFSIDATAFDEYDNATVSPEFIFSDGAVDENGLLFEGEHTCTVRFTDVAGNSAEINLTLLVEPKDVTAPTLSWSPEKIYANANMRPLINIIATDDCDGEVEVVMAWSEGALDGKGRLTIGEHTLTVSAVDATGNKTEKVIPVVVTSGLPAVK